MTLYVCTQSLSHARLSVTLWTVAHQAPLSMGFYRQECWSGLPFPSPGDLLYSGIKPESLTSPALADRFFTTSTTDSPSDGKYWKYQISSVCFKISDELASFFLIPFKVFFQLNYVLPSDLWIRNIIIEFYDKRGKRNKIQKKKSGLFLEIPITK